MPETAKVEPSASLGAAFAGALVAKDLDRLREPLHPEIDFRGLTPEGLFEVGQQVFIGERDGQIGWMRSVCSGYRPVEAPASW